MNDANEVQRLRARVAELEEQVAKREAGPEAVTEPERRSAWWAVCSAVAITLACVLAPLSVTSVWASTQLSDTDRYVQTVAPLAEDPTVQHAVATKVTNVVFANLDVARLTDQALSVIADQPNVPPRLADALPALAVPITNGVQSFTRDQIDNLLASPQFARLWARVNRVAHDQVVKLLEGNQGGAVSAQNDTITLNLGPVIEQVKTRLVARGFDLANNIPSIDTSIVLARSDAIASAQSGYSLLNTLGVWLPIVALALFIVGVLLARDRRRAVLKGALGVVAAMVVLGLVLAGTRTWYVETTPGNILTANAAGGVFDTLVRFLRTGLRALAVLGLLVALAAFLTGPSRAAVKTRATLERGIGSAREGAESAGWNTGRVGTWTYAHKRALRITAVIAAGVLLMFWTQPTVWVVVTIALVVVVLLALIEFLAHPPVGPAAADQPEEPTLPQQRPATPTAETAPTATASDEPGLR